MTEKINSTENIKPKQKTNAELAEETKEALKKFEGGKQVKVSIPAVFKPQFGENLFVSVNGVSLHIPVDGEEHSVPEPHGVQVKEMIKNLK